MRTQMFDSVLSLVKTRWIVETHATKGTDATVEYSFVHPLFYQTIYDLTPAGDKATLHYAVACYLEDAHQRSPSHYAQLGRHFGLAKDSRPKALEYSVRAAVYSLGGARAAEQCGAVRGLSDGLWNYSGGDCRQEPTATSG
jgi:hypothetical protein